MPSKLGQFLERRVITKPCAQSCCAAVSLWFPAATFMLCFITLSLSLSFLVIQDPLACTDVWNLLPYYEKSPWFHPVYRTGFYWQALKQLKYRCNYLEFNPLFMFNFSSCSYLLCKNCMVRQLQPVAICSLPFPTGKGEGRKKVTNLVDQDENSLMSEAKALCMQKAKGFIRYFPSTGRCLAASWTAGPQLV